MRQIVFKAMTVAAAAFMVISCENAYKKAEKAAMAEKARQDSIAAAQKAANMSCFQP